VGQAPHLLGRLVTYLRNQRDDLLAFAAQLDADVAALAARFAVPADVVRDLLVVQTLAEDQPQRWRRDVPLRGRLGARYFPLSQAVAALRRRSVRASSRVENYNSRLRSYFALRRHRGNDYLALLQFFLNHRRYPRSERAARTGHSPAELLTGQSHPHWLELLGQTRFARQERACPTASDPPSHEGPLTVRPVTQQQADLNQATSPVDRGSLRPSPPGTTS
jgi:hypothetical protein